MALTYYKQKQSYLRQIKSNLNRKYLHKKWFEVIEFWLKRFDGYILDYTGVRTDEFHLYESMLRITGYDDLSDDSDLMYRLSNEFEGLHWTSICYRNSLDPIYWSSICEPYYGFKGRLILYDIDHLILDEKQSSIEETIIWLSQMLRDHE